MDYVIVHGVGNHKEDWGEKWRSRLSRALKCEPNQLHFFWYEDLLEASYVNKAIVWAARIYLSQYTFGTEKVVLDFIDDVLAYFLSKRLQNKIHGRLAAYIQNIANYRPDKVNTFRNSVTVIGHSLGSFVSANTLAKYQLDPVVDLVTIGSPYGNEPIMKVAGGLRAFTFGKASIMGVRKTYEQILAKRARNFDHWINIHSNLDLLSGDIDHLPRVFNIKTRNSHRNIEKYVRGYSGYLGIKNLD